MSAATVRPISRYSTVNWLTAIVMVIFHLLAVTALFYFSWTMLAASVACSTGWPSASASAWAITGCTRTAAYQEPKRSSISSPSAAR